MGLKDSKAKEYFADNERFADLCNYVIYNGEKVVKPEQLKEQDPSEVLSVYGVAKKEKVFQRWRDILKSVCIKYTGTEYIILVGIEEQTDVHYAMPIKAMLYDALNYGRQVNEAAKFHRSKKDCGTSAEFLSGFKKEDKLTPVITITLYLGTKTWDGPKNLIEMFNIADDRLLSYVSDYRINLLNPADINDFNKFETGLRQLFEILQCANVEKDMDRVIHSDPGFEHTDRETVEAINIFAKTEIEYDKKAKVTDMCKAWEDHKNIGVMEGRKAGIMEGREAGIMEGKRTGRIDSLCVFLKNGGTDEAAKKMLEASDDDIKIAREIIKKRA